MNKIRKIRFTLVELLLVMGLMGLMVTLALPAFSRMTGNNKVDVMTSNIKIALEQGQSTAVSRNCYVAVVFPISSDKTDVKEYNFGGYRLAEVEPTDTPDSETDANGVKKETSSKYKFVRWIGEAYTNMPEGVMMVASSDSKFTVAPAKVESGNFDDFLSLAGTTGSSNAGSSLSGCKVVIFKSTGECENGDMYICIASVDEGTMKVPNEYDFRQIFLNQFTGRVDYVSDDDTSSSGSGTGTGNGSQPGGA